MIYFDSEVIYSSRYLWLNLNPGFGTEIHPTLLPQFSMVESIKLLTKI